MSTALTKTEAVSKLERAQARLARMRADDNSIRRKSVKRVIQGGSAFLGGALFGQNYAAAGLLGIAGIGLAMMGKEGHLTDGMEAVGIGATYMYGATHPPQVLQGLAAQIQGSLSKAGI